MGIRIEIEIRKRNIILKRKNSEVQTSCPADSKPSYRSENTEGWAGEQVLEQNRTPTPTRVHTGKGSMTAVKVEMSKERLKALH